MPPEVVLLPASQGVHVNPQLSRQLRRRDLAGENPLNRRILELLRVLLD